MNHFAADYGWRSQADSLIAEIRALSKRRVGRLVGVTVGAPAGIPAADLKEHLEEQLPGCVAQVREVEGPLRLLAMEGRR